MNKATCKTLLLAFFALSISIGVAQKAYTPYDDFPGMIKTYKPAYQAAYPDWGKKLYQYPVNYFEVVDLYEQSQEKNYKALVRYYKLWKRNIASYVKDDGSIYLPDMEVYYKRQHQLQLDAKNISIDSKSESDWTFLGPKETFWLNESGSSTPPLSCPWQVNVYSFDVSLSEPLILYGGTETGYVNKTIDNGETWQQLGVNYVFGGGVTATVIHPTNSDIVYVSAGNQIHKTIDGGLSWSPLLDAGSQFHADRLIIDPQNPDKLVAAASNGIQISEDAGESWQRNWTTSTWDVAIQAGNSSRIFGITKTGGQFAIVESYDGGASFEIDANFPTDINEVSGGLLAISPADPNMLLAVMLSSDNTPYLYKKNINLESWSLLAEGNSSQFPMNNGQGYFDLVLEISPIDADLIFAGTTTLFKTSDAGASFHAIGGYTGNFSIHPDIQDMKLLPDGNTWVATDGGMTFTNDNFTSTNNYFSRTNGIVGSDMWGFHQGWNEDIVVGGRYHNGNTAIADFYGEKALRMGGAESPTGWMLQGKSRHAAFNDLGNGWILPQTAEGQPEGRFIFSKYPNMDEYGGRRGNMVFHPNYYGHIILGEGDAIWKSIDLGVSYDMLHDFGQRVRYLQMSIHNPEVLYADVVNRGLYRSEDGGLTWELKSSLCSNEYGGSYWKGKLFFALSPTDENHIYACLQNGTWTSDIGEIYYSTDGGDTWDDITYGLTEYTKNIVVQPDAEGNDLVYLFTNSRNGEASKVYVLGENDENWELFNNNYPAGFTANMAIPFFRDSKLRVGGSAGVWESPMAEEVFTPIVNPWIEKAFFDCMEDTLFFEDHSIVNHQGVSWHWEIDPEPIYMEDANIRNPKVVLGNPGDYDVSLTLSIDGNEYSKEIQNMVSTTTCPSIYDCDNPAELPKNIWELVYVDSEEVNYPGLAIMSFDDDFSSIWHTRWSTGNDPYPHEIQIDMGEIYSISKFVYYTRQDGQNGRIKEYELYISEDLSDWGEAVSIGEFVNTAAPQTIVFDEAIKGQYFRLLALSEVNGNDWASAAEFDMVGCIYGVGLEESKKELTPINAFPVPSSGFVSISLPTTQKLNYTIYSSSGRQVQNGLIPNDLQSYTFDISNLTSGIYMISLQSESGTIYRVKIIKE